MVSAEDKQWFMAEACARKDKRNEVNLLTLIEDTGKSAFEVMPIAQELEKDGDIRPMKAMDANLRPIEDTSTWQVITITEQGLGKC